MAKRKRQFVTYTDDELGDKIEEASDKYDLSVSELLREGARRELQQLEGEDND